MRTSKETFKNVNKFSLSHNYQMPVLGADPLEFYSTVCYLGAINKYPSNAYSDEVSF